MTVNDGDRNDSEKKEGRLCQNCDDAGEGTIGEGEGEQRVRDAAAAATTKNDDYDDIDEADAGAKTVSVVERDDGGGACESSPNERTEVDTDNPGNPDDAEEQATISAADHGGTIGGQKRMCAVYCTVCHP